MKADQNKDIIIVTSKLQSLVEGNKCNKKEYDKGAPKYRDWGGMSGHRILVVSILFDKVIFVQI